MAGQLQFVKVGKVQMATVKVINGCRLGGRSCAEGEIVQCLVGSALMAIGSGQAVAWDHPIPGIDHVEEVPLAMPANPAPQPAAEAAEVFGESDEQEAIDDAADDKAEDAAASEKPPVRRRKK